MKAFPPTNLESLHLSIPMSTSESLPPLFDEFPSIDVDEWRAKVKEDLGDAFSEDLLTWNSLEGVSIPTYLHRTHLEELPHVDPDASFPPLAEVDSSPANSWRIRQPLSHPDPQTANKLARSAVEGGVTDLGLALSPQEQTGAEESLETLEDLRTILEGIDLTTTGIHVGTGPAGVVLYGALKELLSSQSIDPGAFRGSIAYDPVAALAVGSMGAPDRAFDMAEQLVEDDSAHADFHPLSIDARVYHDAGASAVQELTFTIGALSEVLARETERGVSLSSLVDALQLIVPVSTSYFVEIAKLRALRLLLPQVIQAFASEADSTDVDSQDLLIQAETSRRTETVFDPHGNLLRATTEAMAAVLGGCDILSVRPFDAPQQSPGEFSARLARNTQLILQHEAHLDQVADPAAGSYYLETLTDQLAQKAWGQFQDLEAQGGLLSALQEGTVQTDIAATRERRQDAVNQRDHVLVGATHYPALDERRHDDGAVSSNGQSSPSRSSDVDLDTLSLRVIQDTLQEGASLSSITAALQTSEASIDPLPRVRLAEPIESLRLKTERYADAHDGPPTVFLVPMGPVSARSARSTFARNFLGVAGFEIIENLNFETPENAASEAAAADADVVVLCSANTEYASLAPALRAALDDHDHELLLVIAGAPDVLDENLSADAFIHQNAPLRETLERLQEQLGVTNER